MKKIIKSFFCLLFIFVSLSFVCVKANSNKYVYLGGDSIGLEINSCVYIVGKYQVQTSNGKVSPWKNSNIENGDLILSVNNIKVENNRQLLDYLKNAKEEMLSLKIRRDDKIINTSIKAVKNKLGEISLGLFVKDKVLGIGTLSFITEDNKFASLGHGVYENQSLIPVIDGSLHLSNVQNIKKSIPGDAGEKRATLRKESIGIISKNDMTGLYGELKKQLPNQSKIEIAFQDDVELGKATLYTVINNNSVEKFDIEIVEKNKQSEKSIKGIKFKVVDKELLKETGGIIQGMSGSPIVQNDKIIGAVSHVVVDSPEYGYGMYVEWMLESLEND